MNLRDFRIGWRLLAKQPAYSLVVVLGLAIGFAACFLLLGFVGYSYSYNAQVPDSEHVYLVKQKRNLLPRPEWQTSAPIPLREVLRQSGLSERVSVARELEVALRVDTRVVPLTLRAVDSEFAAMFGLRALEGDLAGALSRPGSVALTQASAQKLFGQLHALGQLATVGGKPLRVDAILPDPPSNSSIGFDGLVGLPSAAWPDYVAGGDHWRKLASIYVRLKPGIAPAVLVDLLQDALVRSPLENKLPDRLLHMLKPGERITEIRIAALSALYFDTDLLNSRAGQQYGNRLTVLGMAAIALLILLLAATNYVNLASVRTVQRQREIGVRKVLGASSWRVASQFLAESLLVSLLATVLGLLLGWLLLPTFSLLVNRQLEGFFTPLRLLASLLFGALVGLLAALYPIWIALRLRAAATLLGRASAETAHGAWVRRGLTVFQFAAAMALTGSALAVAWQTHYASTADPGFDPAALLVLDLPDNATPAQAGALRERLLRLPVVAGVAGMSEAVGRDWNKIVNFVRAKNGAMISVESKIVSPDFFAVYQVRARLGRTLQTGLDQPGSDNVMLNASAAQALGFSSPEAALGQLLDDTARVVGIAPDLRFGSMRQAPQPLMYRLSGDTPVLTLRVAGDPQAARGAIDALWREAFPNDVMTLQPAFELFAPNYQDDRRLAQTLGMASLIAGALAAFGIYVLSAHSVQRRAREIVLRKLHGASRRAIAALVGREFALLTLAGALLGLPLAALAGARYLAGFVERAPMGAWPLFGAFGGAALVALLACLRHTRAAMRSAPAQILRD